MSSAPGRSSRAERRFSRITWISHGSDAESLTLQSWACMESSSMKYFRPALQFQDHLQGFPILSLAIRMPSFTSADAAYAADDASEIIHPRFYEYQHLRSMVGGLVSFPCSTRKETNCFSNSFGSSSSGHERVGLLLTWSRYGSIPD